MNHPATVLVTVSIIAIYSGQKRKKSNFLIIVWNVCRKKKKTFMKC
jgi:hypothetical protein